MRLASEFKVMALVRSWNMFSGPRQIIFPDYSILPSVHECTWKLSWGIMTKGRSEASRWQVAGLGKGRGTNKYRLSLYCLTCCLALGLALRNPPGQSD